MLLLASCAASHTSRLRNVEAAWGAHLGVAHGVLWFEATSAPAEHCTRRRSCTRSHHGAPAGRKVEMGRQRLLLPDLQARPVTEWSRGSRT
jgi:hypothetical protein